jgi:hypothetical protein
MANAMWNIVDWGMTVSLCENFRKTVPPFIDEGCVHRYHELIESLESAGDLTLEDFRIEKSKISFLKVRSEAAGAYPPSTRIQYTSKKYCDSTYFHQKLGQLQEYLRAASKNEGNLGSSPSKGAPWNPSHYVRNVDQV